MTGFETKDCPHPGSAKNIDTCGCFQSNNICLASDLFLIYGGELHDLVYGWDCERYPILQKVASRPYTPSPDKPRPPCEECIWQHTPAPAVCLHLMTPDTQPQREHNCACDCKMNINGDCIAMCQNRPKPRPHTPAPPSSRVPYTRKLSTGISTSSPPLVRPSRKPPRVLPVSLPGQHAAGVLQSPMPTPNRPATSGTKRTRCCSRSGRPSRASFVRQSGRRER
jgi:hypothetical protein